jgi:hypothetical protein
MNVVQDGPSFATLPYAGPWVSLLQDARLSNVRALFLIDYDYLCWPLARAAKPSVTATLIPGWSNDQEQR